MPALASPDTARPELVERDTRYNLLLRLAREAVDPQSGIIRGVTVAKSGVRAEGKVVMLDAAGKRTFDEELAVKKLPVFTDEKTLTTLMAAAKIAGPRVKAREDHNDSLEARLGYAFECRRGGENNDLVAADLKVFENYRNRALFFETARETPDQIGISIDFEPEFEFAADRALMRVKKLEAIDVVDAGAITPDGLLLSAGEKLASASGEQSRTVDTSEKATAAQPAPESQPTTIMAEPTLADVLAACKGMTDGYTALSAQVKDLAGKVDEHGKKLAAAPAPVVADSDAMKAVKAEQEKLAAAQKTLTDSLAKMQKERALLGLRGRASEDEIARLATATVEDIEKFGSEKKDYLSLVAETATKEKCSRSQAHLRVMKASPEAYREHLKSKGVYDPLRAQAA